MYNNKKILAIIPARGGSKGIPGKNIRMLKGRPLIGWTIEAAEKSKHLDRIIVTTDSSEIAKISESLGADVPFIRPPELAKDSSPSSAAIKHTIEWIIKNENIEYDIFVLLQPTSPLRSSKHIDTALENFINNSNADCAISVTTVDKSPYWIKEISPNGYLESFIKTDISITRRQDSPVLYIPNGALYIMNCDEFLKSGLLTGKRILPYKMEKEVSIDIDNEIDFKIAEYLLEGN